ncbi:hypothetical protein, partial [Cesiribacter andamanensis]|uniref:hypothetical protein n=1 Tax=Cesiribacter andamanensis TaxID=649507 RepID=UPI00058E5097
MAHDKDALEQLLHRLEGLAARQAQVQQEIQALRREIDWLKVNEATPPASPEAGGGQAGSARNRPPFAQPKTQPRSQRS